MTLFQPEKNYFVKSNFLSEVFYQNAVVQADSELGHLLLAASQNVAEEYARYSIAAFDPVYSSLGLTRARHSNEDYFIVQDNAIIISTVNVFNRTQPFFTMRLVFQMVGESMPFVYFNIESVLNDFEQYTVTDFDSAIELLGWDSDTKKKKSFVKCSSLLSKRNKVFFEPKVWKHILQQSKEINSIEITRVGKNRVKKRFSSMDRILSFCSFRANIRKYALYDANIPVLCGMSIDNAHVLLRLLKNYITTDYGIYILPVSKKYLNIRNKEAPLINTTYLEKPSVLIMVLHNSIKS